MVNQQVSLVKNVERSNSVVESATASASSGQYAVRYTNRKCILEALLRIQNTGFSAF
jgi:hypothetical protein